MLLNINLQIVQEKTMSELDIKKQAKAFSEDWEGKGYEKGESQKGITCHSYQEATQLQSATTQK